MKKIYTQFFRSLLFNCSLFFYSTSFAQYLQQGNKLVGTGSIGASVNQGWSVDISADGNTAIVGGFYDDTQKGAAWIYVKSGGVWSQQGTKLMGTGVLYGNGGVQQGRAVAISADGNTAAIAGYGDSSFTGAVWVFTRTGTTWSQQAKLIGTGATGKAYMGYSIDMSADGNTIIAGGYHDNNSEGATWIFSRFGTIWNQVGNKLVGTGAVNGSLGAAQGMCVGISGDGNTAIIGGYWDNNNAGASWIFINQGGTWVQQGTKLVGAGAVGAAMQGYAVDLSYDGNTALIGGALDNSSAGAGWIFTRSGTTWTQQGTKLVGTGAVGSASQGTAVALDSLGNTAVVGATMDDSQKGAVWVYTRSGSTWTQFLSKLVGTGAVNSPTAARQGTEVAISSDASTIVIGGPLDNNWMGAAWIFTRDHAASIAERNAFDNSGIDVYPNPASTYTNIKFNQTLNDNSVITIYDALGRTVEKFKAMNVISISDRSISLDVSEYKKGIYFVVVTDNESKKNMPTKFLVD